MQRWTTAFVTLVLLVACASAPTPSPSQTPSPSSSNPTASPSQSPASSPLGEADLRYALIGELGRPIFCDRDSYPVGRPELPAAEAAYPSIVEGAATFAAITAHLGIQPSPDPSAAEVLAVYREWKTLEAMQLQQIDGGYGFDYIVGAAADAEEGTRVVGSIDPFGEIIVTSTEPSVPLQCPICLSFGTRIDTPDGPVAIQALTPGMRIWTLDDSGDRVAAIVVRTGSTPVSADHQVVRLTLADGRRLKASPGHPLADGRILGDIVAGDLVDGSSVMAAELIAYAGGSTFDVLPSGSTGIYWADGIPLQSTLH